MKALNTVQAARRLLFQEAEAVLQEEVRQDVCGWEWVLPGQNKDVSLELGLRLMLIALGTNRHGNSKFALHTGLFLPQKLSVDICSVQRIARLSCNFLVSFLSVLGDKLLHHLVSLVFL